MLFTNNSFCYVIIVFVMGLFGFFSLYPFFLLWFGSNYVRPGYLSNSFLFNLFYLVIKQNAIELWFYFSHPVCAFLNFVSLALHASLTQIALPSSSIINASISFDYLKVATVLWYQSAQQSSSFEEFWCALWILIPFLLNLLCSWN